MDLKAGEEIFLKIHNDSVLCAEIRAHIQKNEKKFAFFAYLCNRGIYKPLFKLNAFDKLCIVFACLPATLKKYEEKNIPEDIFYSTMSDISIWINDHKQRTGEDGLFEFHWLVHHLGLNLFRLGRLQFQFSRFCAGRCCINGKKITPGAKILNVHIPRPRHGILSTHLFQLTPPRLPWYKNLIPC